MYYFVVLFPLQVDLVTNEYAISSAIKHVFLLYFMHTPCAAHHCCHDNITPPMPFPCNSNPPTMQTFKSYIEDIGTGEGAEPSSPDDGVSFQVKYNKSRL